MNIRAGMGVWPCGTTGVLNNRAGAGGGGGTNGERGGDDNDAVDMVRHYDKCVGFDASVVLWYLFPDDLHHPARVIESHCPIDQIAEQAFLVPGADGEEIGPRGGIVVLRQSEGAAAGMGRVIFLIVVNPSSFGYPVGTGVMNIRADTGV